MPVREGSLRLLVWNIQNFTLNKINTTIGDPVFKPMLARRPAALVPYNSLRMDYIISNVVRCVPDIFVLVEVVSGRGAKGSLVTENGEGGLLALLNRLRQADGEEWCLVPALKLTDKVNYVEIDGTVGRDGKPLIQLVNDGQYTEGIGVFYRSDRLEFIGPYIWPYTGGSNAGNKVAVPDIERFTRGSYPPIWQQCLPEGNYYAGLYVYPNPFGRGNYGFPDVQSRVPFLTRFREKKGTSRTITLASVHFPPQQSVAETALQRLAAFFGARGIEENEVQVIAGDYNINFGERDSNARDILSGVHRFRPMLGYGSSPTMFWPTPEATPYDYQPNKILDNIALKMGAQADVYGKTIRVLNRVDGPDLESFMQTSMARIQQLSPAAQNKVFRQPMNFGFMGPAPGTSDHLAIFATF